jgi:AcrR family transcriptional regulator
MSTVAYEEVGRVSQKRRTRDALVSAARALVAEGETPTVEMAAERADVSRATAYRYFPNQALLLASAHPEITATSMLPDGAPGDVSQRVELVVERVATMVAENEAQQRTMLRLSLEAGAGRRELLLRQGRVIPWLEEALEPLRGELDDDAIRWLAVAMRSAIGIEAFVWLVDVAGLSRDDAVTTMRWSASAMLDAARGGSLPPGR